MLKFERIIHISTGHDLESEVCLLEDLKGKTEGRD